MPSGASTKGSNTPSGRNKHSDPLKKAASNLKRPGSPNLSEASGAESARKKSKKKHASSQPTATSTPKPASRPLTPVPSAAAADGARQASSQQRNLTAASAVDLAKAGSKLGKSTAADKKRARPGAGSGSDGDATGGEMSDHASRKKVRVPNMASTSPRGSRAGSPNPPARGGGGGGGGGQMSRNGSRAGSPTARAAPPESV